MPRLNRKLVVKHGVAFVTYNRSRLSLVVWLIMLTLLILFYYMRRG